jgi:hypothetical protein
MYSQDYLKIQQARNIKMNQLFGPAHETVQIINLKKAGLFGRPKTAFVSPRTPKLPLTYHL